MKKIISLILVIILSLSLASCRLGLGHDTDTATTAADTEPLTDTEPATDTQTAEITDTDTVTDTDTEPLPDMENDPVYLIYKNAQEKNDSLDDIHLIQTTNADSVIHIAGEGDVSNKIATVAEMKYSGYKGQNPMYEVHQTQHVESGQQTSDSVTDVFVDNEYIYVRLDPAAGYTAVGRNDEAAAQFNSMLDAAKTSESPYGAEVFRKATLTENADGSKTIECTPDKDVAKSVFDANSDIANSLAAALGGSITSIEVNSLSLKFTVSSDGYLIRLEIVSDTDMKMIYSGSDVSLHQNIDNVVEYKDPGQSVTVVMPSVPFAVYSVYDPFSAGAGLDHTETLELYDDGSFVGKIVEKSTDNGINMTYGFDTYGTYEYNSTKDRVSVRIVTMTMKLSFDTEKDKTVFRSALDGAYALESVDEKTYNALITAMGDAGFTGSAVDMAELDMFDIDVESVDEILLDNEMMTAYILTGYDLKEGEYYIPSLDLFLTLSNNGECSTYCEMTDLDDTGREYTYYQTCYGTYTEDGMNITCTLTSYNEKVSFKNDSDLKAYRDSYKDMLGRQTIGQAVYDYYMAIVSGDGYTAGFDPAAVYKIVLEPHTQTGIVTEAPSDL